MISKENIFESLSDAEEKFAFMEKAGLEIKQQYVDWKKEWEEEEQQMQSDARQYPIYTHLKNDIFLHHYDIQ